MIFITQRKKYIYKFNKKKKKMKKNDALKLLKKVKSENKRRQTNTAGTHS